MATKKYKETVASVIALAVGAFLLGRVMRRNDETVSGPDDVFEKKYTSAQSVANNIKKLVAAGNRVYVYYNWNNNKYTVSNIRIPEIDYYFYEIQFVYPGSHYNITAKIIDNWRKQKENKIYIYK